MTGRSACLTFALTLSILAGAVAPVGAQEALTPEVAFGEAATVSYGGRLYDNHWTELKRAPPSKPNALYPGDAGMAKSAWRCVSCHGWDYSRSKYPLGPDGVDDVDLSTQKGRDPKQIAHYLRSGSHKPIVEPLSEDALHAMTLFLCCGQHDIRDLIGQDGKAKGDPKRGKDIYENSCNRCHQADGKAPISGEVGDISSLGWIARNRPAQAAHKIRNGVPGADMLALRFLEIERIADLLAYLQTLDTH